MGQRFKNHGYQVTQEIKFFMVASNIVGSPEWKLHCNKFPLDF
jgi:hypothetical protein